MADNQEKLQGLCQLGYIDFTKSPLKYGGAWAQTDHVNTSEKNIPTQFKQGSEFTHSTNLSQLRQANGGYIPRVNHGIGAPRCTFVYGGIQPGISFPGANYIKGPTSSYAPAYSNDPGLATTTATGLPQSSAGFNFNVPAYSLGDEPTIPVNKLGSQYGQEITPSTLTTYNIWELQNLTYKSMNTGNRIPKFKIKKDYGYEIDCTADPYSASDPYQGPFMYQYFDNNTVRSCVVSRDNHPAYVRRIFPLAQDLLYEKDCSVFYPSTDVQAQKISLTPKYGNCSFHLNFLHNETNNHTSQSNNPIITIRWGNASSTSETPFNTISDFLLYIQPTSSPLLCYWHPQEKNWVQIQLNGPTLSEGEINVYVHFVGPIMLIGFTQDPQDWNVFNPVPDKIQQEQHWYPYINEKAEIAMIINNMTTHFQYSPLTFNNFNLDQQYLSKLWNRNLYWNRYKVSYPFTDYNKAKADFQENAHLSDVLQFDAKKPKANDLDNSFGPSYYADWRTNWQDDSMGYKKQLELEQWSNTTTSTDKNGQEISTSTPMYYVSWQTSVEGPLFLMTQEEPGNKIAEATPEINSNALWDLSPYLTGWSVEYKGQGRFCGFIRGQAEVTLKDLILTEDGRDALALIEENVLLVTLGAGYDNVPKRFFQGLIQSSKTVYTGTGSTTTLICEDVGYKILNETPPPSTYIFMCSRFMDVIKVCVDECGFTNKYTIDMAPFSNSNDNDRWTRNLKLRIGPAMFLTSSVIGPNFSMTPSDKSIFETALKPVLDSIFDKTITASMYWDFNKEQLVLTARRSQSDIIKLYGENAIDMPLPTDRHGVIIDNYEINTDNTTLYAGYYFHSRSPVRKLIENLKRPENLQATPPEKGGKLQKYPWVGFKKMYEENLESKFIQTQSALDFWASAYETNYLLIPYNNITTKVHITEPLKHWAQFSIATFTGKTNGDPNLTDAYGYGMVNYNFDKSENTLTADIKGENFLRVQG